MYPLADRLVFVYGSLRIHEGNHHFIASADRVSTQCSTEGRLYDTGHGFPAMVQHNGDRVYGELYRVTPQILRRLDMLEGYYGVGENNHYDRIIQAVQTDKGVHEAYVYVYPEANVSEMECVSLGDWKFNRIQNHEKQLLYFAYGSCMDDARFNSSNKDHLFQNVLGLGELDGYSLKFTQEASDGGRADLVETDGTVHGKIYSINNEAVDYLLVREGVNSRAYRPAFVDIRIGKKMVHDVLTFLVVNKADEEIPPPGYYLEEILRGGKTVWSADYSERFEEEVRQKFR